MRSLTDKALAAIDSPPIRNADEADGLSEDDAAPVPAGKKPRRA